MGSIVAMVPADPGVEQPLSAMPRLDPDSAGWLRMLAGTGPAREAALARLHEMLVRIARGEVGRRAPRLQLTGPELDDLAYQAAADALIAITGKLGQFRGESRFTTWAYKFVIFEVSAKIGRHFWRHPDVRLDAEDWDRLPARFGFDPAQDPAGLFRGHTARLSSRRARWLVRRRSRGVPFQYASSRRTLRAQAMYTWSRRVLASPR